MEEINSENEDDVDRLERFLNAKSLAGNVSVGESTDSEDDCILDDDDTEYSTKWIFSQQDELEEELDWNTTPTLENCYQINIKYQTVLEESIRHLEFELSKNRELQFLFQEELLKRQNESKPKFSWSTFCSPYFRDRVGLAPPRNDDVKKKEDNDEWSLSTMPSTWSTSEEELLKEAIKANAIEKELNPKQANYEVLVAEIQAGEFEKTELKKKKKELALAETKLKELKDATATKVTTGFDLSRNISYDWMKISVMDFDGRRSPVEIELYWKNYLHPSINKSKWNKDELETLRKIIKDQAFIDWDDISQQLDTSRTPLQCCSKYHAKLHPGHKRFWSTEEKAKIVSLVDKYRIGDYIPWNKLTEEMKGRTIKQVWHQYHYIMNPVKTKGKWTDEEDMMLVTGVWLYGENLFWKICKYVGNRTSKQCHERWHYGLNPNLRLSAWTKEEDKKLLQLVNLKGKVWCDLKEHFKGRTGPMLRRRYNRISSTVHSRSRANYNMKPYDYQRHIFRCVYMCLKNFSRGYKMKQPNSFLSFKKSIFNRSMDDVFTPIRRVILQLPLQTFHKMLNPSVLRIKTYKHGSVEEQLKTYLSLFNYSLNVGRPTKSFKIKENVEEYEKHLLGLTNVLSVFKEPVSAQNKMILLPPMVKTLSIFRSLLLLKNHLLYLQMQAKEDEDADRNDAELDAVTATESYQLLFQQFASLFFWPAILSAVKLKDTTIRGISGTNENGDEANEKEKPLTRKAKRKIKAKEMREKRKAAISKKLTAASSQELTNASSQELTTASSQELTTASSQESTTASSQESTTASSQESTTASSQESTTASLKENTTESGTKNSNRKRKFEPTFYSNQRKSSRLMKRKS